MSKECEERATLILRLRADSGYESDEQHRISADQWRRILRIIHETENEG